MTQEGRNNHVFVICEIGSNHDMQLDRALNLITLAAQAGADAAKFQLFRADDLAKRRGAFDYWHIYKAGELPDSWLPILKEHCDTLDIEFMCTAYSEWAVEAVAPFVSKFKVASFEMADHNLLAYIRKFCEMAVVEKVRVVLSTGMSTHEEVVAAIDVVGASNIAYVLHCASAYPCPPEDANLKVISRWLKGDHPGESIARLNIGYSDHTTGIAAPVGAVALGATCVEKHMTDSRKRVGPDHPFAIEPTEFKQMVEMIRDMEKMKSGNGFKQPRPSEEAMSKYRVVS